jgi:50S ribosomal subunit-associated GTPase HflX
VPISATKKTGLAELLHAMDEASRGEVVELEILVPYGSEGVLAELRRIGGVDRTEYGEGGTRAWVWVPLHAAGRFEAYAAVKTPARRSRSRVLRP